MQMTDAQLLQRWSAGRDAEAFAELFSRHTAMVYATARRILKSTAEAEEVTQECFIALSRSQQDFSGTVAAWLHRVATHRAIDILRSGKRREKRQQQAAMQRPPIVESQAFDTVMQEELLRYVDDAIAQLPEEARIPIVLHFLEGRTHASIAEELGVGRSTVSTRIASGITQVRAWLSIRGVVTTAATLATILTQTSSVAVPAGLTSTLGRLALAGRVPGTGTSSEVASATARTALLSHPMVWILLVLLTLGFLGHEVLTDTAHEGQPNGHASAQLVVEPGAGGNESNRTAPRQGATNRTRSTQPTTDADPLLQRGAAAQGIDGQVVVFGENDRAFEVENGSLKLLMVGDEEPVHVFVHKGEFVVPEPRFPLQFTALQIDGRPAELVNPDATYTKGPIVLEAIWLPRTLLHVSDSETGELLEDVRVVLAGGGFGRSRFPAPTNQLEVVIEDAPSPVVLPERSGTVEYWVGAPSHTWSWIEIDHLEATDRYLTLEPAGSLRVHATVAGLSVPLDLRVYPPGYEGLDPVYVGTELTSNGVTLMKGLKPGDYDVRIELGEFEDPPRRLARQRVTIARGEVVDIEFDVSAPPELQVEATTLSGVLKMPAVPEEVEIELVVEPLSGPPLRPGDRQSIPLAEMTSAHGVFAWQASDMTPGRKRIVVHPLQHVEIVDLPRSGRQDLQICVAELAFVEVTVLDAVTRHTLDVPFVAWSRFAPGSSHPENRRPETDAAAAIPMEYLRPAQRGVVGFWAPQGRIVVGTGRPGYEETQKWIELDGPTHTLTIPLAPLATLVIGFLDHNDAIVPCPVAYAVRAVKGDHEWHPWSKEGSRQLGIFDEPGLYRIEPRDAEDDTFAPVDVWIVTGQRVELDIPLHTP